MLEKLIWMPLKGFCKYLAVCRSLEITFMRNRVFIPFQVIWGSRSLLPPLKINTLNAGC